MRHLKCYFLPVLAVTSFILSASFVSPVSAVEMAPNVHPVWTNATPDCTYYDSNGNTYYNDLYNGTTNFLSVSSMSCGTPAGLQSKNTYAVYSFILDNIPNNDSFDGGIRAIKARHGSGGNGGWGVIGYNIESMSSNGIKLDIYIYGENSNTAAGTVNFYNSYNASELLYFQPKERITASGASYWQVDTTDFEYNYTDVLNQINSKLGNVNTGITNIRDGVNSINSKLNDLKSTQEQANQDANDRYQDEKDTIDNNASDAQNTANNADFSFTVGNPLTTWLGLFTGSNCVNIPTIASWIHSNETSVCSPWSSSIRDVTTPIISVLSGTILFGFIVRWLNGSSFNESIEVG